MYKTESQVRKAFWEFHPQIKCVKVRLAGSRRIVPAQQNSQPADTRMAFVDFVDMLHRNGEISEKLADRVTL